MTTPTELRALLAEAKPQLRYANKGAMMAEESNAALSTLVARITAALSEKDEGGCICKGNWRMLVSEYSPMFGRDYKDDRTGEVFRFYGLVHTEDDYYFGMWNHITKKHRLLSCVGNIEGFGMTPLPPLPERKV